MKVEVKLNEVEMESDQNSKIIPSESPNTAFLFDKKIDELTSQLQRTMEVAGGTFHYPKEIESNTSRKMKMEPPTHHPITSSRSLSLATEEMDLSEEKPYPSSPAGKKRDWKIPRFLRRTQSATEDEDAQKCGGSGGMAVAGCSGTGILPVASKAKIGDGERSRNSSGAKIQLETVPHSSKDRERPRSSSDVDKDAGSNKWRVKGGTDMKFGLGFLKRRHTEGHISPPASVRPSPEEAKKWAESFQNLMNSKYGQCLFKAFLRREFSHENIEFWIAVEQYRKTRERKLPAKAQKIINEFVLNQAPREVNLDSVTKDILINSTSLSQSQPDYNTFDQAQKKIQSILEADAYIRFLQSDLYLELIHPERYANPTSPTSSESSQEKPTFSKSFLSGNKEQRKGLPHHADSTE